ncbi:MAG: adenosine kinase [Proteobacteria bacterium]|nr:adenosine kinase [Pseudomonadota bacterium]
MQRDVAGLGNALMDALVVLENDDLLTELDLHKGTMHLVDHAGWQAVYDRIRDHKVTFDSGGSCANSIATIGFLGGNATYCGQVGDDQMGAMYASRMTEATGQHALRFTGETATGKCLSIISADAERTMLTDLGAAVAMRGLGDFVEEVRTAKVTHFTGYTLLEGPMRGTTLEAMLWAKQAGGTVSLDVADPFVVTQIRDLLWALLAQYVDVVFLNADEARALTDEEPERAIETIAARASVSTVIVKLGAKGSLVRQNGETTIVEADMVEAIDTTGAGDAYAGAFLYGYTKGWTPASSGALASAVAALTVSQIGAVVKDRAHLETLIAEHAPREAAVS